MIPHMEKVGRGSGLDGPGGGNVGLGGVRDAGEGSSAHRADTVASREADARKGSSADHAAVVSSPRGAGEGSSAHHAPGDRGESGAGEAIFAIVPEAGSADNDVSFNQELQNL